MPDDREVEQDGGCWHGGEVLGRQHHQEQVRGAQCQRGPIGQLPQVVRGAHCQRGPKEQLPQVVLGAHCQRGPKQQLPQVMKT